MEISKDETILICGTIYGYVVAYQIEYTNNNTNIQLNLIKKLYDHNSCINSISINDNLNLLPHALVMNIFVYIYFQHLKYLEHLKFIVKLLQIKMSKMNCL